MHKSIKKKKPTVLLDGDHIRELFSYDLDYTIEGRLKNAKRVMRLCQLLDSNNINVVCAILSISEKIESGVEKIFLNTLKFILNQILILFKKRASRNL